MELAEFIVEAKRATYVDGGARVGEPEGEAKELTYEEGNFRYRNRYYGTNPFVGEELVRQNGKIVWAMNYYGKCLVEAPAPKEIYKFLRRALMQVESERPFRGPNEFSESKFRYTNEFVGDIDEFTGVETIFCNDKKIYRLYYHGGKCEETKQND